MKLNSSFNGTNVSCLRSNRRKMLLSLSTTPRAKSGSTRINDDTVFSVLNKKWGLIWLDSASMRAFNSNCWCRSRFISMRVLFQIFSGTATAITVASTDRISHQFQCGSIANSHLGVVAITSATRPSSSPPHPSSGSSSHDVFTRRASRTKSRGMFKNVNGPKLQRSSLVGIISRINPPSSPAVAAAGMPSHSWAINEGIVMISPPIGPTTRPPRSPIRNAPSSDRSANRYGWPTRRNTTPTISGGVMNSISFNFWSGSRSSVKSTRRNVFQRASSAANEAATPTLSNSVKSKSRDEIGGSIILRKVYASQLSRRCKPSSKWNRTCNGKARGASNWVDTRRIEKLHVRTAKLLVADGSNITKENLAKVEVAFREWRRDIKERRAGRIADAQRPLHDLRI